MKNFLGDFTDSFSGATLHLSGVVKYVFSAFRCRSILLLTSALFCLALLLPGAALADPLCGGTGGCWDGNPCTDDCGDAFGPQGCSFPDFPNFTPCLGSDGDFCNSACVSGECVDNTPASCDDENYCTDSFCHSPEGCVHLDRADGTPCTCETNDTCLDGECTGDPSELDPDCDDRNACTIDSCNEPPARGRPTGFSCSNSFTTTAGSSCSDGLFCNGGETCAGTCADVGGCFFGSCPSGTFCSGGTCYPNTPISCSEDSNCPASTPQCLGTGVCNPQSGLVPNILCLLFGDPGCASCQEDTNSCFPPAGTICDDGAFCNGPETCDGAGTCQADGSGDPCAGNAECNDVCDEINDDCEVADGTPCTDDGLWCTGTETCQSTVCTGAGDPCFGMGTCIACNDDLDNCEDTDLDVDLICAPADNCPVEYNPDQLNSDCPPGGTDTGFGGIDCASVLTSSELGCCDGGDVCDVCPANNDDTQCNATLSGGQSIGAAGGSFTLGGCISVDIPAGALGAHTSISVSTGAESSSNPLISGDPIKLKKAGGSSVHKYIILPHGQTFLTPVTLEFCWDDSDSDGTVDLGTCDLDPNLTCDSSADCGAFAPCNGGGSMPENKLLLRREGANYDYAGFGTSAPGSVQKCGDTEHQTAITCGPAVAVADCADVPGTDMASVANCCDMTANTWPWQTCNFSEYYLGELAGDLVPGKGSEKTDCHVEWSVVNPFNAADKYDRRGLLNYKQSCTDGDSNCDKDGEANGTCVFEVGLCLNVDDPRLFHKKTLEQVCAPNAIDVFELKKPKPDSRRLHEADAADALLAAVMELDEQATLGGHRLNEITFSGAGYQNGDACTNTVQVEVPLNGRSRAKGKIVAGVETMGSAEDGAVKDKDKLLFRCDSPN